MTIIRERTDSMTVEDYFAFDEASEIRHEYIDGEVYPMTGGTVNHGDIIMNASFALMRRLLDKGCRVYAGQVRHQISLTRYLYPDVSVICGARETDERSLALHNPVLVAEVTSPSTINFDRGDKLDFYQSIESLEVMLLVDQLRPFVELYARQGKRWLRSEYSGIAASVPLSALNIELPLAELYRGIEL
ncbi:MAG: Uma2 family endonuclease [Chloroflexi bacterium]|nr:Uma2 family endonuclease [Chloroflexota bacterium]MCY4247512.1 Uma2 family endonuclease [Chloroflexota bacterium]